VGAPRVGPVLARERDDGRLAARPEPERGEAAEVLAHALLERAREERLGEERAEPRARPSDSSSMTPSAPSSHRKLVSPSEASAGVSTLSSQ